ncbi:uncharacterized protein [Antedon mediterranea]|uniref:uncharacterized protein n=1 Tax=Antedon mediterranea TaxID=105859 RepID=UPI003AF4FB32
MIFSIYQLISITCLKMSAGSRKKILSANLSFWYMVITIILFTKAHGCIIVDGVCDCRNQDLIDIDCTGATTILLENNDLSRDSWPSNLNLSTTNIVNVSLSENELTEIPTDYLPVNLETLIVSNNKIERIKTNQLSAFKKLKVLKMSNNSISEIDVDAFDGLCHLKELILDGNRLRNLKNITAAVRKAPMLSIVNLSQNNFKHIFIPTDLEHLQVLDFGNNMISDVSFFRCTYNLPNLKLLNLNNNNLTSFPKSIVDSLQDTDIMLVGNPLRCDCDVLLPLVSFNTTGVTCMRNYTEVNMNTILVQNCQFEVDMETQSRRTVYSTGLILSSASYVGMRSCSDEQYCSRFVDSTIVNECDEITEICWDLPDSLCEETDDLIHTTELGYLNLTEASQFSLNGYYNYKEYHTCHEIHLYTINGRVYLNKTNTIGHKKNCGFVATPCSDAKEDSFEGWKIVVITVSIAIGLSIGLLVIMFICRRKQQKSTLERAEGEVKGQDISSQYNKKSVPHYVTNGYLRLNEVASQSVNHVYDDLMWNAQEAESQGYAPLLVDTYGYLIVESRNTSVLDKRNGYYMLLPQESKNEILVDMEGYLSVNLPMQTVDQGYVCVTLRKDQGHLGQLISDPNMYIKLERETDDETHMYEKLITAWKLLKFWQNKEEEHCNQN